MKIQDWPKHSGLPKKYVDAWVRNAKKQNILNWKANEPKGSPHRALDSSFTWDETKQGDGFWGDVHSYLLNPSKFPLPPFPKQTTHNNMKKHHILIKDGRIRKRVNDGKQTSAVGHRVLLIASNGEILMTSELLNSVAAVAKNIRSAMSIFNNDEIDKNGFTAAKDYGIKIKYEGSSESVKKAIK